MRSEDLRAPILVFSLESEVETRKRTALGLGAQGDCFTSEGLLRTVERVLDPHLETN